MNFIGLKNSRVNSILVLCNILVSCVLVLPTMASQVELTPSKDATLYSYDIGIYDPADPTTFPMADGQSHLHVGDTNNNKGVQRGLMQFDLSGIPSDALVTNVSLTLTVADVPNRVLQRDINFWLVAMEGLSTPWDEGSGSEQSPAQAGDTTWFHTVYDPDLHGELGNTSDNEFRDFYAGATGYWPAQGYFGNDELADTAPGAGSGGPFDDAYALSLLAGVAIDDEVTWSNSRMTSDVQSWIDGTKDNFGWIMIGEEWIDGDDTVLVDGKPKTASSKIDFLSSESAVLYYGTPPTLNVTYTLVPEPGAATLLFLGLAVLFLPRIVRARCVSTKT